MEVHTKQLAKKKHHTPKEDITSVFYLFLNLIIQNLTMNCERTSRNLHLPLIDW